MVKISFTGLPQSNAHVYIITNLHSGVIDTFLEGDPEDVELRELPSYSFKPNRLSVFRSRNPHSRYAVKGLGLQVICHSSDLEIIIPTSMLSILNN